MDVIVVKEHMTSYYMFKFKLSSQEKSLTWNTQSNGEEHE